MSEPSQPKKNEEEPPFASVLKAKKIAPRVPYDFQLLQQVLTRDGSETTTDYTNVPLGKEFKFINLRCKCGLLFNKVFCSMKLYGAKCEDCMKVQAKERAVNTFMLKYGVDTPMKLDAVKKKIDETNFKKYGTKRGSQTEEIKARIVQTNLKKYGVTCSLAAASVREKCDATMLQKYGVKYASQVPEIRERQKQTNLKNLGVEYPGQSEAVKEKMRQTVQEKYNVSSVLQIPELRQKAQDTIRAQYGVDHISQAPEIKEKKRQTTLEHFGVEYPGQSEIIKDKIKETNMERYQATCVLANPEIRKKASDTIFERYGVEHAAQNDDIKDKIKATNMARRNVEHVFQDADVKEKIKQTMLEVYGVEHNMHVPEFAEKGSKTAYKRKAVITPSGNTLYLQGFEPMMYEQLLKEYQEDDIVTDNACKPKIWWTDASGKRHRYYCDFFIPSKNLIIEVKSTFTYKQDDKKEKITKTMQACKDAGYNFELFILDKKGQRVSSI